MEEENNKKYYVLIWEKKWLTLEEAAAYSGIGRNKLRELSQQKNCPFAILLGGKLYIIREKLLFQYQYPKDYRK